MFGALLALVCSSRVIFVTCLLQDGEFGLAEFVELLSLRVAVRRNSLGELRMVLKNWLEMEPWSLSSLPFLSFKENICLHTFQIFTHFSVCENNKVNTKLTS